MADYRQKEMNGIQHACCPYCSFMYPMEDKDGAVEVPNNCRRCKSPMALGKAAQDFQDAKAAAEHDPNLSALGRKMRGEEVAA